MNTTDWSGNFPPSDQGLFFDDLGDHIAPDERTPNHPSVVVPPPGSSLGGNSQQDTPVHLSEQEHYYLEQLEDRLYESSQGTTPNDKRGRAPLAANGPHIEDTRAGDFENINFMMADNINLDTSESFNYDIQLSEDQSKPSKQLPSSMHQQQQQQQQQLLQKPSSDGQTHTVSQILQMNQHQQTLQSQQSSSSSSSMQQSHPRHMSDTQSSAFPPSSSIYPPHTPSMMAANKGLQNNNKVPMASPILPSQNEKSYNEQHFFYKHHATNRRPNDTPHQAPTHHIRPDSVFTPLVSPAVTPLESQINLNTGSFNPPLSATFEPLTSPALGAQSDKRRSSSVLYGPNELDPKASNSNKRKTPHGTPVLAANKQSPAYKAKFTSMNTFDKLPEASVDSSKLSSGSSTPMHPPQGKKIDIKPEQPTMMGFTMGRLAEQQNDTKIASTSPTITPVSRPKNNKRISYNSKIVPKSSSSSDTSPVLTANDEGSGVESSNYNKQNLSSKPNSKSHSTKKASHKVAEQGRRNRMNIAIHELASLIPQYYHDEVSIPSKATTVELASKYIKNLLKELEDARS